MTEKEYTKGTIIYLQKSLKYYKSLGLMTKRQKDLLLSGRYDAIEKVIDEKEKWIERIKTLDREFARIKGRVKDINFNKNIMTNELSTQLQKIIRLIIRIEDESRIIAVKNKDKLKGSLSTIGKGKKMLAKYSYSGKGVARFIDIKR